MELDARANGQETLRGVAKVTEGTSTGERPTALSMRRNTEYDLLVWTPEHMLGMSRGQIGKDL
jgi:hypothetical protein